MTASHCIHLRMTELEVERWVQEYRHFGLGDNKVGIVVKAGKCWEIR